MVVKVEKQPVHDKSISNQNALSICSLIEASLIRLPSSVIGGEWSIKTTLEYEVFVPSRDNTTRKYRRPVAFMFRLSRPRFSLQYELRLAPEPDKLVSYANV